MSEPVERIVNLALYFAAKNGPITADAIRAEVAGYSEDQDDDAFGRMFERDKELLRRSGFAIEFDEERQEYSLDRGATYSAHVDLSAEEAAVVTAAGSALAEDPSFPFASDLRLALAKIGAELDAGHAPAAVRLADEDPSRQATFVATLTDAATRAKRVEFGYTNSQGVAAPHEVEPYGLFLHDGRWYLVARDRAIDEVRTYAVARMTDVATNPKTPKTPDFERPADFEVGRYIRLPFQYGSAEDAFEAVIRFAPELAWRARSLIGSHGELVEEHGALVWHVEARSPERLMRFVIENGPGIDLVAPVELAARMTSSLAAVEAAHA